MGQDNTYVRLHLCMVWYDNIKCITHNKNCNNKNATLVFKTGYERPSLKNVNTKYICYYVVRSLFV